MKHVSALILTIFFLFSCHSKNNDGIVSEKESFIEISVQQFDSGGMKLGEVQKMVFDELVNCHGNIVSKPSGLARISTPISGQIEKIYFTPGQKISKGQVIFEAGGNMLIELQKDFAETSSQLIRVRSEYERLKSLYSENVGTEKEYITAQSEFKGTQARYSALMMKLNMLGLDAKNVESGNFYQTFSLRSPISGYLSRINVSLGQYSGQETSLAEVFDPSQLILQIAVFEKDIQSLKENQRVMFRILGDNNEYYATLKSLGKNVDNETKTILCFAEIDDLLKNNFINNTYVEARVITSRDSVYAVPEEAILRSGESRYILVLRNKENENYYLEKTSVETGRTANGFIEIKNEIKGQLLLKGAYNIVIE